ncbi:cytochrome c oxidase subunit II [Vineibacter terrae]|uniref:cytochrome c oxidase subunit II n=1 Tax=Vineibacter terrae TaxID=2586908 RepID=UPI002E334794|nr:cytochrome c oxidase subunit II [Vineibacter terrae]HEX2887987.1 cytochrome c oxidase subunit II [Vineibacter terrae]
MMGRTRTLALAGLFGLGVASLFAGGALAQFVDLPHRGQMNLHDPATPVMEKLVSLHTGLLWVIGLITLLVLALMVYVFVKFRESANPTPSTTTHNTLIEVAWTVIPVIILVGIAIPSFRLLYFMDRTKEAGLTVKVTAHQWYWTYEYPDFKVDAIDSRMVPLEEWAKFSDADKRDRPRLLATDNPLVVPANVNVRVLITSTDVMHSWAVPAFGIKQDAIIGRTNETWFNVVKEGLFYGQCSQICGENHAFMPIAVKAVSKAEFDKWIAAQSKSAALAPATDVASAIPATPAR